MKRGQEEAPIELLVAIVVLGFAIIIAYGAYSSACADQFDAKMKAELSHLARDMELVYRGAVGTSQLSRVDFSPAGCPGTELDSIRVGAGAPRSCEVKIGSQNCALLTVWVRNPDGTTNSRYVEYVDIDPATQIWVNLGSGSNLACSDSYGTIAYDPENPPSNCRALEFRPYSLIISKAASDRLDLTQQGR